LKIQLHKMKQKLKLQEEWHSAVALLMQIQWPDVIGSWHGKC
jgi:hypothetical protein